MADTRSGSNPWDEYWKSEGSDFVPHQAIIDMIVKYLPHPNEETTVVEIGAGTGVDSVELASRGYPIIAFDYSPESIRIIKSRASGTNLPLFPVRGDASNLPFKDESIDLIFHQGFLEHFREPGDILKEHKRALKGSGHVIADVPQTFTFYTLKKKWKMYRDRWFAGWETQYSPRKLSRILESSGFEVKEMYGWGFDFPPFAWMSNIENLGKNRFGKSLIPESVGKPLASLWKIFERSRFSNYFRFCVGAVAGKKLNVEDD